MEESDSALVTCEVARNDLSHSTNLLRVLSGCASCSVSLPVTASSFFLFIFCWRKHLIYMHFKWGSEHMYLYKRIVIYTIPFKDRNGASVLSRSYQNVFFYCLWHVFAEWKQGHNLLHTLLGLHLLPQSGGSEQSQLFWELTQAVVHRSVVL